MIKASIFSKENLFLLFIIAATAVVLSILSYQYYVSTSNQIFKLAAEDIRSNARIQVHDLSISLANKLDSTTNNLRILSESPTIQSAEYDRAKIIINSAENSTSQLVDFYMWLDKNGKILWISNINQTTYQKYKGTDLSYRPYFIFPRDTHKPFYSSTINSNDKVPRLYISYPIFNKLITRGTGAFNGVVVAGIRIHTLGNVLQNELSSPEFQSNLGLLDSKGTILYIGNQQYSVENVFGNEMQATLSSILSTSTMTSLNNLLKRSLQSNNISSSDIVINGKVNTIAYEPVVIGGEHFMTLYVVAMHNFASDVGTIIEQQQNFSIFVIVLIGGVAIGIAFLVLLWNKRLKAVVDLKTAELIRTNNTLIESNKQLAEANEQLKVHDKMQKEFVNIAAHELRTPIQPILTLTQVIRSKLKDDEQIKLLDVVIKNSKRLRGLTEDILDVTRIESRSLPLKKEWVNLNDVISNVIQDYRNQLLVDEDHHYKANIQLNFEEFKRGEQGKDGIFVEADKQRLTQVISNLLSNAVKFMSKVGGGVISIILDKQERGDGNMDAVITVKDTGEGIDPDIFPRLFSKFASKSFRGTGLGLFICKSIVEAHGGRIWAENNVNDGKGATFHFSLPIK